MITKKHPHQGVITKKHPHQGVITKEHPHQGRSMKKRPNRVILDDDTVLQIASFTRNFKEGRKCTKCSINVSVFHDLHVVLCI